MKISILELALIALSVLCAASLIGCICGYVNQDLFFAIFKPVSVVCTGYSYIRAFLWA